LKPHWACEFACGQLFPRSIAGQQATKTDINLSSAVGIITTRDKALVSHHQLVLLPVVPCRSQSIATSYQTQFIDFSPLVVIIATKHNAAIS
jgi:hypothetical protein